MEKRWGTLPAVGLALLVWCRPAMSSPDLLWMRMLRNAIRCASATSGDSEACQGLLTKQAPGGSPGARVAVADVALRRKVAAAEMTNAYLIYRATPASARVFHRKSYTRRLDIDKAPGLAAKAGLTELLSMALSTGAVIGTFDQNVVTLSANAQGIWDFIDNQPVCDSTKITCGPAANAALSATFNVNNASAETTPLDNSLTSTGRKFTGAALRYSPVNQQAPSSPQTQALFIAWQMNGFARYQSGAAYGRAAAVLNAPLQAAFPEWLPEGAARDEANNTRPEACSTFSASQAPESLVACLEAQDPLLPQKVAPYVADLRDTTENQGAQTYGWVVTGEFSYNEPALQPKILTGRSIFSWTPKPNAAPGSPASGTLTGNFGLDMYQTSNLTNNGGSRWRDCQMALQYDHPFGGSASVASLSLGAYLQYMMNPGIIQMPDNLLLSPTGWIRAVGAILTLKAGDSGAEFPIGVTWSNRTDLSNAHELRGYIGFSLDALAAATTRFKN